MLPILKCKLLLAIKVSPFYNVVFDESMNSVLQKEKMDIHIRFWDSENSFFKTRYFGSQFMYRANQDDLYQSIARTIGGLPKTNMNQHSMDGPNTNWAVLEKFVAAREENDGPKLAEIASCSLHIVSGYLNDGVNISNWKVNEVSVENSF